MRVATEFRFAFYTAAFSFIWLMLEYVAGLQDQFIDYNAVVRWFALFIPVVFFYIGLKRKRDADYDGSITFGQCFRSGLIMTVFAALMIVPLQAVFHYFINPAYFDDMIQHEVQQAVNNGQNPKAAYDAAAATYNMTSYALQSGIGMLVLGTLLTSIYSFMLSRNRRIDHDHPITPVDVISN